MTEHNAEIYDEALTLLERLESPALAWGIADSVISRPTVIAQIESVLAELGDHTSDAEGVLAEMEHRSLVINVGSGNYRTRIGEAVRLFASLRQLFPQHLSQGTWASAPHLVTDYRLLIQPRRFPRRNIPADVALDEVGTSVAGLTDAQRELLSALLVDLGQPVARFQVEATARILNALDSGASSATVISAGTGAGKTLAFYLPALADLIARRTNAIRATQVVAIYPRTELLKDQLAEVVRRTSTVRPFLDARQLRPISVGVLFGQTPHDMRSAEQHFKWPSTRDGDLVCPFLTCPVCGDELRWRRDTDVVNVQLICANEHATSSEELLVTRRALVATPPDILLTSAEMLNRGLSNTGLRHVLGVGRKAKRSPRLLLLDEVHLYGGTAGAQTAFVLRRWREQSRHSAHVVGLSATLEEPEAFFSSLTGVPQSRVVSLQPRDTDDEMYDRGAEYLLALRGNPMSETALLSTTIQSLMLLRRILDQDRARPSEGLFGSKAFAFADNLDVANRLHADLSGAEARTVWDRPIASRQPLAALRRRNDSDPDVDERAEDGQVWDLPAEIDPQFDRSRSIELVSSQSPSATPNAEIVVATASLEVGIDDPRVGAILQHKASRSGASFIQRRGRAGRSQLMRPLTMLVLSDYGRDRLAYQGYEQLFSPRVRPTTLPTSNRHLQKLQATAALLDFLANRLEAKSIKGDLWRDIAGPATQPDAPWGKDTIRAQRECAALLSGLLTDASATAELEQFLQQALQLDLEATRAILWAPPRALLTTAIPALLRRIESNWVVPDRPAVRETIRGNPMPENMTTRLYDDLMVPEVLIHRADRDEPLGEIPVRLAMQEFAPGRVSKRFTPRSRDRLWVPVDPHQHLIDVSTFLTDWEDLGFFQVSDDQAAREIRCLRPIAGVLQRAPANVPSSNNSELRWHVQYGSAEGDSLDLPAATRWDDLIEQLTTHMHSTRSEVEVRRFATGARADHPAERNASLELTFVDGATDTQTQVAIGFAYTADALCLELRLPDAWPVDETLSTALRGPWFRHLVQTTDRLPSAVNQFSRDWLATLYMATITAIAARHDCDAREARERLEEHGVSRAMRQTVAIIFKAADPHDLASDTDGDGTQSDARTAHSNGSASPGAQRIATLLTDESVCACLHSFGESLIGEMRADENRAQATEYLSLVLATTIGSALREAFQRLCPSIDADGLTLDVAMPAGKDSDRVMIWLTEEVVGGAGLVEEISARVAEDPRTLFRLMEAALGLTDHERVDQALRTIASRAQADEALRDAIATARSAEAPQDRRRALLSVLRELQRFGIDPGHSVATAVAARVTRAGATHSLDNIVQNIVEKWDKVERRLGFEADPRALAYALRDDFVGDLEAAVGAPRADMGPEWRFSQIYSVLWPAGSDARAAGLNTYTPYASLPRSERLLVNAALRQQSAPVDVGTASWRLQIDEQLRSAGAGQLSEHHSADRKRLRQAILELLEQPVDLDLLLAHPRVTGAHIDSASVEVDLDLVEIA